MSNLKLGKDNLGKTANDHPGFELGLGFREREGVGRTNCVQNMCVCVCVCVELFFNNNKCDQLCSNTHTDIHYTTYQRCGL